VFLPYHLTTLPKWSRNGSARNKNQRYLGLGLGLITGLVDGLVVVSPDSRPSDKLRWSWREARSKIVDGLVFGLAPGLITGLVIWPVLGLIIVFRDGFVQEEIPVRSIHNEGTWRSAINGFRVSLVVGLVAGLVVGLAAGLVGRFEVGLLSFGQFAGLVFGLVGGLVKKAILHRKNALFYKTMNGARVGDVFMSLIHTCELNKVNPFDYLTASLRHQAELKARPAEWMPWNYRDTLTRIARPAAA
jgi:MFS family permease